MRKMDISVIRNVINESNPPTLDKDYVKWENKIKIVNIILDNEEIRVSGQLKKLRKYIEEKK